jgi:peptidoglycan/LPS O-acetylase OafA/YrhL
VDTGRVGLKAFYIRRAYRILPPMLLFLLIVGALGLVGILTIKLSQWLSCLFLYSNYQLGGTWTLAHFWSLSLEEHFYLTWPILFAFAGVRRALPLTIGISVIVMTWRCFDSTYRLHPDFLPTARTDNLLDGLLWGAVMALLCARPNARAFLTRLLQPLIFVPCLIILLGLWFWGPESSSASLLLVASQPLLLALLVVATVLHPNSIVGRILELRPLRWIGRLSYSLYLYQQIFVVMTGAGSPLISIVQRFPLNVVCAFACAFLSYHLIEKRFIREGYRVAARIAGPKPSVAQPNLEHARS